MTEFEALVSLNTVADIGSIRLKKLLNFFDRPQDILNAPAEKLKAISGIGEKTAAALSGFRKEKLDREIEEARKQGVKIITCADTEYPENLKQIYDPPIVLYVKGEIKSEDRQAIAIVGSRRASFYGLSEDVSAAQVLRRAPHDSSFRIPSRNRLSTICLSLTSREQ